MPHTTTIKPEFGRLVKSLMGDFSYMQVSYKTGISAEYIRMMVNGRVPSEATIYKLARGLDADIRELLVAAGYEEAPIKERLREIVHEVYELRGGGGKKTHESDAEVRRLIDEILAEEGTEHVNGEPEL